MQGATRHDAAGQGRFLVLDGLRGAAALSVLFTHLGGAYAPLAFRGYLAVDLFFLLSGVVLAQAYGERLRAPGERTVFFKARLRRLGPLYLAGLLVGALAAVAGDRLLGAATPMLGVWLAFGLVMAPMLIGPGGPLYPLNPPAWSLFLEVVGNLGYGLAGRIVTERRLQAFVVAAAAVLVLMAGREGNLNFGFSSDDWGAGLARMAFSFALGLLLHRLYRSGRFKIPAMNGWWVVACAAIAIGWGDLGRWNMAYDLAAVFMVFPALTVLALTARTGPRTDAVFGMAGRLSYPLYALHAPIVDLAHRWAAQQGVGLTLVNSLLIAPLLALAWAADRWFDRPVRAALARAGKGAAPILAPGRAAGDEAGG